MRHATVDNETRERCYREGYHYLRQLIDPLSEQDLLRQCPHCPEWTLRDVLVHLMMVAERSVQMPAGWAQRVRESLVNTDPVDQQAAAHERDQLWNRVVDSLRALPLDDLYQRWEVAIDRTTRDQWRMVADFAVHVGDLDEALGQSGSRQLEMVRPALDVYTFLLNSQLEAHNLTALQLVGSQPDLIAGDLDSQHLVAGTSYELLRAITGRRTRQESDNELDWNTTPDECKPHFAVYQWLTDARQTTTIIPPN